MLKDRIRQFCDFDVQEYLLPIINFGGGVLDEYSDTEVNQDDCKRLIDNCSYFAYLIKAAQMTIE